MRFVPIPITTLLEVKIRRVKLKYLYQIQFLVCEEFFCKQKIISCNVVPRKNFQFLRIAHTVAQLQSLC